MNNPRELLGCLLALLLASWAGLAEAQIGCTVTFSLDDAVTFGALQLDVSYPQPAVEFDGSGDAVDCNALTSATTTFNDDDSGTLKVGLLSLGGTSGPVALASCAISVDAVPTAADFTVTVTDASSPTAVPLDPVPSVSITQISCVVPTTSTSTLPPPPSTSTSTTMATVTTTVTSTTTLPGAAACTIGFQLANDVTLGSLQFQVDYSTADGGFEGSGEAVSCTSLVAGGLATFNDNDAARRLAMAFISLSGFSGPTQVGQCSFVPGATNPAASDFQITVTDAANPAGGAPSTAPSVVVSSVSCPSGEPVCGDGRVEGDEECDDGGANSDSSPDACRRDCTSPVCGDGVTDPANDEECDDGSANSDLQADACRTSCRLAFCGDDVIDSGEECDEGSANSDADPDHCRLDCTDEPVCGDVDDNGSITAVDALAVLKAAVGLVSSCPLEVCDANGNGSITAVDAVNVLKEAVGLPAELVCNLLVTIRLEDDVAIGALQYEIDYSATGETFLGEGGSVVCTNLVGGGFALFNNDTSQSKLLGSVIHATGFSGPTDLAECRFRARTDVPDPAGLPISVTVSVDPDENAISAPLLSLIY